MVWWQAVQPSVLVWQDRGSQGVVCALLDGRYRRSGICAKQEIGQGQLGGTTPELAGINCLFPTAAEPGGGMGIPPYLLWQMPQIHDLRRAGDKLGACA